MKRTHSMLSFLQLVGEGYQDDVTLDNLHSVVQDTDVQFEDGSMADDDISGELHVY